ncbi:MAG: carboxylating nicotinate-nucleotide diphosphorylase [Chloroflexota bacterium]
MSVAPTGAKKIVERALAEDIAWGDLTTSIVVPPEAKATATAIMKEPGVVCGVDVLALAFHLVDDTLHVDKRLEDGSRAEKGAVIATIAGAAASILTAERVALNFLQRLSGIATVTARYVEALGGLDVRLVETRKTTPGLRLLEKYAVRVGGGYNHRQNLSDGILIKDNHLAVARSMGLSLGEVVRGALERAPHTIRVEVEVETLAEMREALAAGADSILLDNMSVEDMRRAVEEVAGRAVLEASGGITLETLRAVAETGVDIISVGALTHSVRALDISLEIEPS